MVVKLCSVFVLVVAEEKAYLLFEAAIHDVSFLHNAQGHLRYGTVLRKVHASVSFWL